MVEKEDLVEKVLKMRKEDEKEKRKERSITFKIGDVEIKIQLFYGSLSGTWGILVSDGCGHWNVGFKDSYENALAYYNKLIEKHYNKLKERLIK